MAGDSFFLADMHFLPLTYPDEYRRHLEFIGFLEQTMLSPSAQALYIVGDLFDFWYEYTYYIPKDYFEILYCLKKISLAGKEIHYLAGNHDFKLGRFFEEHIGMKTHQDEYITQFDQQKTLLHHGDGLAQRDWKYRLLKKALRSSFNQKLFAALHPDLGMRLGLLTSKSSRCLNPKPTIQMLDDYIKWAKQTIQDHHYDAIIIGHTHLAYMEKLDQSLFINLGSWINDHYFLHYNRNEFQMKQYSI